MVQQLSGKGARAWKRRRAHFDFACIHPSLDANNPGHPTALARSRLLRGDAWYEAHDLRTEVQCMSASFLSVDAVQLMDA